MKSFLWFVLIAPVLSTQANSISDTAQATFTGLQNFRSAKTGFVADRIQWNLNSSEEVRQISNPNTSPTNLGLDLLFLAENFENNPSSAPLIEKIISNLERLERHTPSGFFFGWYDFENKSVQGRNISSVDNIHLAIGLLATSEFGPNSVQSRARRLLSSMDWWFFVDRSRPGWTIIGNYQWIPSLKNWEPEGYRYDYFGSESRSLAALLPVFLKISGNTFSASQTIEFREVAVGKEALLTWDGGLFQMFLPQLLLHESQYSPRLRQSFQNATDYIFEHPHLIGRVQIPRAHSASDFWDFTKKESSYGSFGVWEFLPIVKRNFWNPDEMESTVEKVFSPHALLLALEFDVKRTTNTFQNLLAYRSKSNQQMFFQPHRGWLDALHVQNAEKGMLCPTQTSLNQLMSALALKKQETGMLKISNILWEKHRVPLQQFYQSLF